MPLICHRVPTAAFVLIAFGIGAAAITAASSDGTAAAVTAAVSDAAAARAAADAASFKVGFYNIRSGLGIQPLRGHTGVFADVTNCTDRQKPLNAWGVGVVQRELERLANDGTAIALGLAEAWHCASPANVAKALGWRGHLAERNGTSLVARFGFSGAEEWLQLDTSRNRNPKDTMWIVRTAVCRDERCSRTIDVYAAHWYGTGDEAAATLDRQASQTVEFMAHSSGPHVLVGDLNVFEGDREVCHQQPNNTSLQVLRRAGYVDGWTALKGPAGGYTGMLNRAGCGSPEGAPWKRIDYAWSRGLTPASFDRFGLPAPGDAAPSDHAGILAGYR